MAKICESCGCSCQDSGTYCANCGAKLPETSAGQNEPQVQPQQPQGGYQSSQSNGYQSPQPGGYQPSQSNGYQSPQFGGYQPQQFNGYQQNGGYQSQQPNGYQPQQSGYQSVQPAQSSLGYQPPSYGASPVYRRDNYSMDVGGNMKWFKFVIYFQLIFNGIICSLQFFLYLGLDELTKTLYDYGFRTQVSTVLLLDSTALTAIVCGALAALAFFTRSRLARFKEDGPKFFLIFHSAAVVRLVLEWSSISSLYDRHGAEFKDNEVYVGQLIGTCVMMALSYYYFKKRDFLFVE